MQLKDNVAIVTGGAQGIGMAVCQRLLREGAKVAIFDAAEESSSEIAQVVQTQKGNVAFLKVDVSNLSEVERAVNRVIDKFSHLDEQPSSFCQ